MILWCHFCLCVNCASFKRYKRWTLKRLKSFYIEKLEKLYNLLFKHANLCKASHLAFVCRWFRWIIYQSLENIQLEMKSWGLVESGLVLTYKMSITVTKSKGSRWTYQFSDNSVRVRANIVIRLYVFVMSQTHFRVNPHSIVAWMWRNSLLEAGTKPEV